MDVHMFMIIEEVRYGLLICPLGGILGADIGADRDSSSGMSYGGYDRCASDGISICWY